MGFPPEEIGVWVRSVNAVHGGVLYRVVSVLVKLTTPLDNRTAQMKVGVLENWWESCVFPWQHEKEEEESRQCLIGRAAVRRGWL